MNEGEMWLYLQGMRSQFSFMVAANKILIKLFWTPKHHSLACGRPKRWTLSPWICDSKRVMSFHFYTLFSS
jgi:hypothetical protein